MVRRPPSRPYTAPSSAAAGPFGDPFRLFSRGGDGIPRFFINSSNIQIMHDPAQFYDDLKRRILTARCQVVLATLYIGSKEQDLIDTLATALSTTPSLTVHVLVDFLRGTRKDTQGHSTASLLAPLVKRFGPERVRVSLYHTPELSGVKKLVTPPRWNEGLGIQHIKAYVFDSDVVISGANLSTDYFTNRQDRYMAFLGHTELSEYFKDLVSSVSRFSYQLNVDSNGGDSSSAGEGKDVGTAVSNGLDSSHSFAFRLPAEIPPPYTEPRKFRAKAHLIITEFLDRWARRGVSNVIQARHPTEDTLVMPTVQMAPIGIRQDQAHTTLLFNVVNHHFPTRSKTIITSAYFNFASLYKHAILSAPLAADAADSNRFEILIAAPEANGFYKSKGMSRHIPDAYTLFELEFLNAVAERGREGVVQLREWRRSGWTYHGKGFWYYLSGAKYPSMTIIGSPNYGHRSIYRDLEAQLTVVTASPEFGWHLHKEAENLRAYTTAVTKETLANNPSRQVPPWIPLIKPLIESK
ncbi:CDP-diacylglycerol--glycerol-3-phosphate 3-phosphatidyltransferase, partial [Spiromyces aspiralis]